MTLPPMMSAPSPNFNARTHGKKITYLILHYTETETGADALALMQNPAHQASAHYMVDVDGTIYTLVSEDMRAWHAGKSWWEGEEDINSTSIGIEVQNAGHSRDLRGLGAGEMRGLGAGEMRGLGAVNMHGFPEPQIYQVIALCKDIIARHGILPPHVLAHSDVAPNRKIDPGELFPWATLARSGIGLWPMEDDDLEEEAKKIISGEETLKNALVRYGYDPRVDFKTLVTQFHRHFCPDKFMPTKDPSALDKDTGHALAFLLKAKLASRRKI